MRAFEFQAKPKNGCIEIPVEYKDKIAGIVRVIILSRERSPSSTNIIDQLLEQPLEIEGFAPLTREELYDRR